jgi:uncharacterized protein (TIRG00374 family)
MENIALRRWRVPNVLVLIAKFGVTLVAFAIIARYVDPNALLQRLGKTAPAFVVASVVLALLQFLLVGFRWRLIAGMIQPPGEFLPSSRKFCQIIWITSFFGQFMPFIAGDALRVWYLRDAGSRLRVALKSTVVDRGVATAVLFIAAPLAVLLSPKIAVAVAGVPTLIGASVAAAVALVIALAVAEPIARSATRWRAIEAIAELLLDVRRIVERPRALSSVVLLCVLVHCISCAIFALLAQGENLDLGLIGIFAAFPVILLAASFPIAISGWGVREGLTVILLSRLGVAPEAALLLSMSFGLSVLLASLPGAVMLLLTVVERRGVPSGQVL